MRRRVTDDSSGMKTARGTPHIKAGHVSGLTEVTSRQAHHSMRVRHDGTETRRWQVNPPAGWTREMVWGSVRELFCFTSQSELCSNERRDYLMVMMYM